MNAGTGIRRVSPLGQPLGCPGLPADLLVHGQHAFSPSGELYCVRAPSRQWYVLVCQSGAVHKFPDPEHGVKHWPTCGLCIVQQHGMPSTPLPGAGVQPFSLLFYPDGCP